MTITFNLMTITYLMIRKTNIFNYKKNDDHNIFNVKDKR